jgi:NAD(P)H-dependent FMN reductase
MAQGQDRLKVMVVIASTRPTRVGLSVGTWIRGLVEAEPSWDLTVADLKEIDLPMMNEPKHPRFREYQFEHTKRWSELVDAQDAYIFVFPEYNHGMTAPLKNAIDYLSLEWGYKPVGLVSYGGVSAGLRATQQVKTVVAALKMMPLSEAVTIPSISDQVKDGVFVPTESATGAAGVMLAQLRRWAVAMKPLRTGEL